MSKNQGESIRLALEKISGDFCQLTQSDLSGLVVLREQMTILFNQKASPIAFQTQAKRGIQLLDNLIMGDTKWELGLGKLGSLCQKMVSAYNNFCANLDCEPLSVADYGGPSIVDSQKNEIIEKDSFNDSNRDLLERFVGQQLINLEDLEGAILDLEKNKPGALDEIRRYLHTLKGEFGVLGLDSFSHLVHAVEEKIEQKKVSSESMFKLKDWLMEKMTQFSAGFMPSVEVAEKKVLLDAFESCGKKSEKAENSLSGDFENEILETEDIFLEEADVNNSSEPSVKMAFGQDPSFISDFINESRDHINNVESNLLNLETDPGNRDYLNSIFRACHTIKGLAGFLDLNDIKTLAHKVENLMDQARNGDFDLTEVHVDLLLQSMDIIKLMIHSVEGTLSGSEYIKHEIPEKLVHQLEHPLAVAGISEKPVKIQKDKKMGEILLDQGSVQSDELEAALKKQAQGDERKIGEILIQDQEKSARSVGKALVAQVAGRKMQGAEETLRVPVDRLDQLIDAIGEAVIAHSMIVADPMLQNSQGVDSALHANLQRKISQTDMIMRQIQELSMSLRMISVKGPFQKMARLVRDLSKKMGKNVEFIMEGADTELDKSVVEHISDPLIHMVRNSVDHGVESVEERSKAGKSEKAKVTLRAFHKAGNVYIEIEDDGKGLDRDRILEKAISRGLCSENDSLTDSEVFQFIFEPGFSTAQQVTDVSGRGVGMDVVKKNIEALRGSVEIRSEKGKGSCFAVKLPLTLAIINGIVVRSSQEQYIIPTLQILETLRAEDHEIFKVSGRGEMIKLRNEMIRLVRLHGVLNQSDENQNLENRIIIVVEDVMSRKCGFIVDEILDQQSVVIKNLGDGVGDVPGVSGGAIMNNGNVSLILDVTGVIRLANESMVKTA